ncbi:MAG: ATP-binding protein [Hamadaea sp.]|uniref:ATP-binding protein n=1 Tax=Hamadaea sp. TaxID=2024425 RepID=UPI001808571D|nr:ATP-binding protein [Hamadaea sp.]NUR71031.1 ATP-binding protein [Hamadaea sp.]NUT23712.1 ATP-binding protein [Hamadaea sp.]
MSTPELRPPERDRPGVAADLLEQQFDAAGLYALRSAIAAHASELGADSRRAGEIVLACHELAINAVRHGGGRGRLRLWRSGDLLYCQVADDGPGLTDLDSGSQPVPLADPGGRGLWIVRRLAASVEIANHQGATVTAAFALH